MKKLIALAFVALLAIPAVVSASVIPPVGSIIRFTNAEGSTGGGEFGVAMASAPNTELFRTFCLERNELLDFQVAGFKVDSYGDSVKGGLGVLDNSGAGVNGVAGVSDPVSGSTAWLFYEFAAGTLAGYDYTANSVGHVASADMLQNAIWYLEDELTLTAAQIAANPFLTAASAASNAAKAFALTRVRAMNISYATARDGLAAGTLAQSTLIVVPEPATLVVWSALSLVGLAAGYRKFAC